MNSYISSIGSANPGADIPQQRIADFMERAHQLTGDDARKLRFIYRQSGILSRQSVLRDFQEKDPTRYQFFPPNEALEPFPSTVDRMAAYRQHAPLLGADAASRCLAQAEVAANTITHLVVVSCTGMYAPGLEVDLQQRLGLAPDVERYSIQFMGCYAAFNGLKLADALCQTQPDAQVLLVCVELCTLHFQKTFTEDNLLANALFGDGAAAALIVPKRPKKGALRLAQKYSALVGAGEEDMAWEIGNFGFEMKLTKYVPELLSGAIDRFRGRLQATYALDKIPNFAIHPGGKQILAKVAEAFAVGRSQLEPSYAVLAAHGNMSSATILFVLERWMQQQPDGPILAMGFGPGLTLETLLLHYEA
ncbi:MAG: type III polyketide synthase [Nitritalea sp.]